jgi:uncharacterized OB-fold protein
MFGLEEAMTGARAKPMATRETAPFWEAASAGALSLPRCRQCKRLFYPPPPRCTHCLTPSLEWETLSGLGRLASWTTIHVNLSAGLRAPFVIGEVELAEQAGLIIAATVVGASADGLRVGAPMRMTFEPGEEPGFAYPRFEPVAARS